MKKNTINGEKMRNETYYIFVYGSLKEGHSNHYLLRNSEYIGEDSIKGEISGLGFPMVDLAGNKEVEGEIYRIDFVTFSLLDQLEGYPLVYDRSLVYTNNGNHLWVYHKPKEETRW